jgi:hypothetical protein
MCNNFVHSEGNAYTIYTTYCGHTFIYARGANGTDVSVIPLAVEFQNCMYTNFVSP